MIYDILNLKLYKKLNLYYYFKERYSEKGADVQLTSFEWSGEIR